MAAKAPLGFDQQCNKVLSLVMLMPDEHDREQLLREIETLVVGLGTRWIGCRVAFLTKAPDTIEGIEDL